MWNELGALAVLLLIAMVLTRVALLRRRGVTAMKFGEIDKSDFFIPPFAFLYFYVVFAAAFGWPTFVHSVFFATPFVAWIGVASCVFALLVMFFSLASFGTSFRVGIDANTPGRLVTTGIFAYTRNPIYVAFAFLLLGEFLILPTWITIAYLIAGVLLFHRQVIREEAFMCEQYGDEYRAYRSRVRRYL